MTITYQTFLETPTQAGFARLQRDIAREEDYSPSGDFVGRLSRLLRQGRLEELRAETEVMPYSWIASPAVHLLAALAAEAAGDHEEVEVERFLCETLLEGLAHSGQGTRKSPYRLTYLTDAADLLAYRSLTPDRQRLVRTDLGHLDIIRTTDGQEVSFLLPEGSLGSESLESWAPPVVSDIHFRLAAGRFSSGRHPW